MIIWAGYDDWSDLLARLETLHANQLVILSKLKTLTGMETNMAIDLTSLTAEVTRNSDVTASIVQLVNNLAAQIAAIPPSTDPQTQAALDQLKTTLSQNDDNIAAAVVANTPAA